MACALNAFLRSVKQTHGKSKKRFKRAFLCKRKYSVYANTCIVSHGTTRKPLAGMLITCRFCGFLGRLLQHLHEFRLVQPGGDADLLALLDIGADPGDEPGVFFQCCLFHIFHRFLSVVASRGVDIIACTADKYKVYLVSKTVDGRERGWKSWPDRRTPLWGAGIMPVPKRCCSPASGRPDRRAGPGLSCRSAASSWAFTASG